jgi:O-antigen ligase
MYVTNTHNGFIEFIVENGLPGMVLMLVCLAFIGRRFRRFLEMRKRASGRRNRAFVAQACIYACAFGVIWRYFFESGDKLYFLLFAMLTMIVFLPDEEAGGHRLSLLRNKSRTEESSAHEGDGDSTAAQTL